MKLSETLSWLYSLLSFHVIMFSLLGVAEVLLRKTHVAVWTHQPALDSDRIPCVEAGSVNCQRQDFVARCTIDIDGLGNMKAGKR